MKRFTRLALILALGAVVAACNGDDAGDDADPPAGNGDAAEITITGFSYSGAETVSVGDTVVVTNEDELPHSWTDRDGAFDSGSLSQGSSYEYTFEESGEFEYFCTLHPEMTGTITVSG